MPNNRYTNQELSVLYSLKTLKTAFSNIVRFKIYFKKLLKVELLAQYKTSWFGILWMFLSPFFIMGSWLVLKFSGILKPGDTGVSYPIFLLISTTFWGYFTSQYESLKNIISTSGPRFIQAVFPFEVVLVVKIVISFINFIITFFLVYIILLIIGIDFTPKVFLIPLYIAPLIIVGISFGLVLSVFEVLLVDFYKLFNLMFRFLIYTAPIIYSETINNSVLQSIVMNNPLTYLIIVPRDIILNREILYWDIYLYCSLGSIFIFIIAYHFYSISLRKSFEKLVVN